ncbi:MAG TPA: FkbM family methyltransferase [Solirubrobacteraceae bacterium]|nr:FkbM family methyltransferase [Solirubrobacteraceae bacterium]
MRALTRVVGAVSRRTGRPELLAAVNATARESQREEVGIAAVLAASLRTDGRYVDVGTNRGQVLAHAVRVAPRAEHVAFEPIPALAAEVARAFPQVECRCKALGAKPESAEFCHFRQLDGWSGLRRQPEISDTRGDPEYITVEVSTLDAELAGTRPAVVKIDVEGAELGVLEGGRALLGAARPLVIFEHVPSAAALYGADSGSLWELLDEIGYEVFSITGEGPFTRQAFASAGAIVNWLAVPRGQSR